MDNFVEDAATGRAGWLEARGTYADYGGGRDVLTEGLVAFNVAGRAELAGWLCDFSGSIGYTAGYAS